MEARVSGAPLTRLLRRKARWALALLALRAGREVEREWLAGTLWPESATPQALYNLREQLSELRRALGEEARRLETPTRRTLRLDLAGAAVDALAFDAAIARASRGHPRGDEASLAEAVSLYRGPLLQDCAEEWCLEECRPREQAYMGALATLANAATASGESVLAADHLRRAVGVDPYREDLQRALMEALAAGGNPAGALLVYRQFHTRLWREMAATPAEETTTLFRQLRDESRVRVRAHLPKPSAVHPSPEVAAPDSAGNLPQPLSDFVGRQKELGEVGACLTSARLVTLTGTGGIGKTRLAIRVGEECAAESADGA
jgi:DNA-binding SARP family transcriptional activator